jgi:hypothetical protein
VVDAARPEKSVLHPFFTWDDLVAAENYRHFEARALVRAVYMRKDENDEPTPAYVNVRIEEMDEDHEASARRVYQDAIVLAKRPTEYETAKEYTLSRIKSAHREMEQLQKILADHGGRKAQEKLATVQAATKLAARAADKLAKA